MRILHENFHINGFALSLALKLRLRAIRKWPVKRSIISLISIHTWSRSDFIPEPEADFFIYLFVFFFLASLGAKYELIISRLVSGRKNPRI